MCCHGCRRIRAFRSECSAVPLSSGGGAALFSAIMLQNGLCTSLFLAKSRKYVKKSEYPLTNSLEYGKIVSPLVSGFVDKCRRLPPDAASF
jgi:hypothetical protein